MTRLALDGVEKRFGATTAVAPLTLALAAGTIHGVLGENGAGKSTLVRMVAGVLAPDAGTIAVDGAVLPPGAARAARRAGVGVVHQHFALVGALTVAENLLLGRAEVTRHLLRPAALARAAQELAVAHGLDVGDPRTRCDALPVGTLARIEILRALAGRPRVLLLDEPTAALTPPETAELFATLRRLRDGGMLIVLITHKLAEATALCDRITVLRGGRVVASLLPAETTPDELAAIMVGGAAPAEEVAAALGPTAAPTLAAPGEVAPVLVAEGLTTPRARARCALAGVALRLLPGEIHGIAGVDGNGQDELAGALYGTEPRAGDVRVAGVAVPPGDVGAAQGVGLALVPSDRQRDGLALGLAVWENVLLAAPVLARFTRGGTVDRAGARALAARLARDYRVVLRSLEQPIGELSGGNRQRVVIGRALAFDPLVLIAQNPTRGLDVAATAQVHATLRRVAAAGTAVLLISSDLDEILVLADRVQVLFRGRLLEPRDGAGRAEIGRLMAGLAA